MLKRLKRQFIVIVMTLVGVVLVAVLGSTYFATYQMQESFISDSLERSLNGEMDERPTMGEFPRDDGRMGGLLSLLIEVNEDGFILQRSSAPVVINVEALNNVISRVLDDGEVEGADRTVHIAWKSVEVEEGTWRIALVDTSTRDTLLHEQAARDLQIVAVALVALFAISWWLANWALKPVEHAWDQQRRFVSDASHELKTPLAVILANLQILERDQNLDEDAMHWVQSSLDEATHMKELVGDLLQLARADETSAGAATSAMRHEDIDLSEMVESASLEFDAVAFERGCLLEEQVDEGIHITGDPEWIERLVRILIDNACKYGATGTTVTIRLTKSGNHPVLTVHNEGNPIDAEDLPHVFERFYRSDKARERDGEGGFGLGLAIAKGIVDSHGGKIGVTSTAEDGTTFTATL